ncbi:Cytochrome c4 [invertebrate metagenome]|uniref:Cytochrome c4 n=1 Tax=invertebrate metagenome TaxID=1711999 RepID=A0A2H9TB91_9ZZZZ
MKTKQLTRIMTIFLMLLYGCDTNNNPTENSSQAHSTTATEKKIMALCSGCHGYAGISNRADTPNLAGQKQAYLIKQLLDFQQGKRANHPSMTHIARMLTKKEIYLISHWYSAFSSNRKNTPFKK